MFKTKNRQRIVTGKKGESIASSYLKKSGYRILETNYRCAMGEIDIIARDKDVLVFVEVKTRSSEELGYPEQAVHIRKQKKISQLALWYLEENKLTGAKARFDVVAVTMSGDGEEIKLIQNAFDFINA